MHKASKIAKKNVTQFSVHISGIYILTFKTVNFYYYLIKEYI